MNEAITTTGISSTTATATTVTKPLMTASATIHRTNAPSSFMTNLLESDREGEEDNDDDDDDDDNMEEVTEGILNTTGNQEGNTMTTDEILTSDQDINIDHLDVTATTTSLLPIVGQPLKQQLEPGHVVLDEIHILPKTTTTTTTTTPVEPIEPVVLRPPMHHYNLSGIIPRPFQPWPNRTLLPCYPPRDDWASGKVQNSPSKRGFLYVKPYKTGSSTTSGVNLRIARNVAQRRKRLNITICDARFDHGPTFFPGYTLFNDRISNASILWSVLRDPTKRAISQFFHMEVSRKKLEPTDANLIRFLRQYHKSMMQDYYYKALYTKAKFDRDKISPIPTANQILRTYNFIGITERLDESLVVLMMLFRLKMADILYLSAKTKGGYDDGGGRGGEHICTYIWPSFVTPGVDAFLHSKEWRDTIRYDMLLYQAVNQSLEMTIDTLGRSRFNDNLQKYQAAQKLAEERCLPTTVFPCDIGGVYHPTTDCIWNDSGCGTTCLDTIATELNLW
jgi:hypothetical protein